MKQFESIDELKSKSEFFQNGKIIPRRILKGPRRFSSRITFGCDTWVFNTDNGYLCACDVGDSGFPIRIRRVVNAKFKGSPYMQNGVTAWLGNSGITESEWLKTINESIGCKWKDPPDK